MSRPREKPFRYRVEAANAGLWADIRTRDPHLVIGDTFVAFSSDNRREAEEMLAAVTRHRAARLFDGGA